MLTLDLRREREKAAAAVPAGLDQQVGPVGGWGVRLLMSSA